jgi:hypothetical protein
MGEYRVARLRLERAIAHGERLAKMWNDLPADYLCTLRVRLFPDGSGVLTAENVGIVPDEFSLVLGEQLYQLRSALDACIYQSAVYATRSDPPPREEKLEFPITWDRDEWPGLKKRKLQGLPVTIQQGIESVQPFKSTHLHPKDQVKHIGRSLGILHDLARKDRHRQLHVVGSSPFEVNPIFDLPEGVAVDSVETMPPSVLNEGTVIVKFHIDGFVSGMKIVCNPQMKTSLGSDEPPPPCDPSDTFDNRLTEMVNAVGLVIAAFEQDF